MPSGGPSGGSDDDHEARRRDSHLQRLGQQDCRPSPLFLCFPRILLLRMQYDLVECQMPEISDDYIKGRLDSSQRGQVPRDCQND